MDARRVVTIGPDDRNWRRRVVRDDGWCGSIVRLQPPHDATDSQVETLRDTLVGFGAWVRVTPRATAPAVVRPRALVERVNKGVRQIVGELIAESRCDDHAALTEIVEAAISAEGL